MKAFFSIALLLLGCGRTTLEASRAHAVVSDSQTEGAFEIIRSIDYLPFDYLENGCYARSLYMSMELAAREIPSSSFYLYGDLHPRPDVTWTFHVAPYLKTGEKEWILDPSFQSSPLPLAKWIAKSKALGEYSTEIKAGSAYFDDEGRTAAFDKNHLIANFGEMPAFLTSDILSACASLYNYLGEQYPAPELAQGERDRLIARSRFLLQRLKELGKLEKSGKEPKDSSPCAGAVADFLGATGVIPRGVSTVQDFNASNFFGKPAFVCSESQGSFPLGIEARNKA